jgi:hypothetical protein
MRVFLGQRGIMTFADEIDSHRSRCRPHLLQLHVLARTPDGAALSRHIAAEVRDATNAIIAEAEAMSRTAIQACGERDPRAETFVWVRVTRLAAAADLAVSAARTRDVSRLRAYLRHFDTLTSAIWAVERAVYGEQPVPRQRQGDHGAISPVAVQACGPGAGPAR